MQCILKTPPEEWGRIYNQIAFHQLMKQKRKNYCNRQIKIKQTCFGMAMNTINTHLKKVFKVRAETSNNQSCCGEISRTNEGQNNGRMSSGKRHSKSEGVIQPSLYHLRQTLFYHLSYFSVAKEHHTDDKTNRCDDDGIP